MATPPSVERSRVREGDVRALRRCALRRLLLLALGVLAAVGPMTARAQQPQQQGGAPASGEPAPKSSSNAPPAGVEVIRIKGRAVTGIQTEVPQSVTQFDSAELQSMGAQNISDLAKVTPNVEIKTAGATSPTFFIRGVGLSDFSANAAGAVAIYRDEIPINAPAIQLTPLFDLENVEVLRGPQGTGTGGRNASGGSIKMYSRKPSGNMGAELTSSFGNYDAKNFEGSIEAPLVEEVLAARLAFRWSERGPTAENRCGGKVVTFDERLPPPPTNFPPTVGPSNGPAICNEGSRTKIDNPRYQGPSGVHPPNYDRFGNPNTVNISTVASSGTPGPDMVPDPLPTGVNNLGNWSARGILRFEPPGTDMSWVLNVHGTEIDQLSTLGQAMGTRGGALGTATAASYTEPDQAQELADLTAEGVTNPATVLARNLAHRLDINPYKGDYDRVGPTKLDTWGAALHGEWQLGPVTLTSNTGYDWYTRYRDTDQDFTPDILFENVASDHSWQVFQELRAEGELADLPVRWNAGAYYLTEDLSYREESIFQNGISIIDRNYVQDTQSYAVYAGWSWDFLDNFTLEGGVRWNWDQKDFDFIVDSNIGVEKATHPTLTNGAPTGGLTLTYRFNEDVSAYWKYTHGWKPGTFNSIATNLRQVNPAEPETIDAWETGLRGTWAEGRVQAGGALFYYKYSDYQVFIVVDEPLSPPALEITNASDAQVYGAELDLRVEPLVDLVPPALENLVITTRAGWLETEFLDFTTQVIRAAGPGQNVVVTLDFSGNSLINSPKFKLSSAAEWTFDLGRYGAIIPRYDFAWTSDIYFDANNGRGSPASGVTLPQYAAGQKAYWLHNIRLAYRLPEGNIEIAGWCRNLTNQVYKSYAFDASAFSNVVINFVGEPRTYGLDFTVRF